MPDSHDTEMSLSLCRNSVNKACLIAYSNGGTEVEGNSNPVRLLQHQELYSISPVYEAG